MLPWANILFQKGVYSQKERFSSWEQIILLQEEQISSTIKVPRLYIFFMLNSAEHEISNAHKYDNIQKFCFFSGSDKPTMLFFLLVNVKMPTVVGILTFEKEKFHAQLS